MNKKSILLLIVFTLLLNIRCVYAIDHNSLVTNENNEVTSNNNVQRYTYNSYYKQDTEYTQIEGKNYYKNEETGYIAFIDDGQDLINTDEEVKLLQRLIELTKFGNAGFVTTRTSYSSFKMLCQEYYRNKFSEQNGSIFVIEMSTRQLGLYTDGSNKYIITGSKANSITDNVYRYASRGEYYECADEAFREMYIVLDGGKIAEPMRYTSNIFIALTLALFFGFIFVMVKSKIKKATYQEIVKNCDITFEVGETSAVKVGQHKVYSPVSSSSGGSSGGGGGGGGGSFGSHGF